MTIIEILEEQPMPTQGSGRPIVDMVVEDLAQRRAKGIRLMVSH